MYPFAYSVLDKGNFNRGGNFDSQSSFNKNILPIKNIKLRVKL